MREANDMQFYMDSWLTWQGIRGGENTSAVSNKLRRQGSQRIKRKKARLSVDIVN